MSGTLRACLAGMLLILASCASNPIDFQNLSKASGKVVFTLDEGIQVKGGSEPIYLARGNYRIVKDSGVGGMYLGPDFGIVRKSSRGYLGHPGGVWIPRDPNSLIKVFVLVGLRERLYPDLSVALTLPAKAEREMVELAAREGVDLDAIARQSCAGDPLQPPGSTVGWATAALICAFVESEIGKPDVISELSRSDFDRMIGPAAPVSGK